MAIIPRYTSRALPPGAQPGLITGAQSRGEAGAGLARAFGGAVVEGIDYARRRDEAAKTAAAAKFAERIEAEKLLNVNLDHRDGETALAAAEAETTRGRARAVASAKTGGAPAKDMARISLADFDDTTRKQAEALKTRPHLKARFDAMVESSRAPHELRMLTLENERRAGEEKAVLAAALGELAAAATDDPAMAPGVTGRGLAQIESAMEAGMVTPEEAAAMQGEFADNVHMAAMRGQIAADPALALAKLESGELDDIFEEPEGAARGYAGRTPREIAEAENFDPGFFEDLLPGLPLDEEIVLNDLVDRDPWRSPGETFDRNDIVTLLPDRALDTNIDPEDLVEKLPRLFPETPGDPEDWLRLAVERYDGEYGLDREKLDRVLPGLLAPPPTSPLELLAGEAGAAVRVKQAGESAAARAKRRVLENDMADHLAALDERGQADEAVAARARAELPHFQYAAFQAGQIRARERHATRAEYAFMTADEIEADIAQQAPGGGPRDTDERAAAHAIRAETRDEVLAARAEDPAGWAMRDEAVAAAFAAAQENPDDPALARQATEQRLALQREMGIESRLLSEAEKEALADELQSLPPVERLARLRALKQRHGDLFGQLRKELGGDIDGATARLALFAGRPQLAALLAKGIGKAGESGLAKATGPLPPAVFIHADAEGSQKFDLGKLGTEYGIGQIFILPDGSRVLYDGDVLVPTNADTPVTLAGADDPATPTPPIPLGKKGPGPESAGGDAESEHVTLPSAPEEGEGLSGAGGETAPTNADKARGILDAMPAMNLGRPGDVSRATLDDMVAIAEGGEPKWVDRDLADKRAIEEFLQASPEKRKRMLEKQIDQLFGRLRPAVREPLDRAAAAYPTFEERAWAMEGQSPDELGVLLQEIKNDPDLADRQREKLAELAEDVQTGAISKRRAPREEDGAESTGYGVSAQEKDRSLAERIEDDDAREEYLERTASIAAKRKELLRLAYMYEAEYSRNANRSDKNPEQIRYLKDHLNAMRHLLGTIEEEQKAADAILSQYGVVPSEAAAPLQEDSAAQLLLNISPEAFEFISPNVGMSNEQREKFDKERQEIELATQKDLLRVSAGSRAEMLAYLEQKGLSENWVAQRVIEAFDQLEIAESSAQSATGGDRSLAEKLIKDRRSELDKEIDMLAKHAGVRLGTLYKETEAQQGKFEQEIDSPTGRAYYRGRGKDKVESGVNQLEAVLRNVDALKRFSSVVGSSNPDLAKYFENELESVKAERLLAVALIGEGLSEQLENGSSPARQMVAEMQKYPDQVSQQVFGELDSAGIIESYAEGIGENPIAFTAGLGLSVAASIFFPGGPLLVELAVASGGAAIDTVAAVQQRYANVFAEKLLSLSEGKLEIESLSDLANLLDNEETRQLLQNAAKEAAKDGIVEDFLTNLAANVAASRTLSPVQVEANWQRILKGTAEKLKATGDYAALRQAIPNDYSNNAQTLLEQEPPVVGPAGQ